LVVISSGDFLAEGADRMGHEAVAIFKRVARLRETVVFIDEVEEFVRDRAEAPDYPQRLITTAMLTLLQTLREAESVVLLFATNHVKTFDPAIMRPGRFDLIALIPPPSLSEKLRFLRESLTAAKLDTPSSIDDLKEPQRSTVERATFNEWRRITDEIKALLEATPVDRDMRSAINRLLDQFGDSLVISAGDWTEWKTRETIVY
jgi:SpoVK/Ycf46/Vps4 family AAA+-type ATPase